MVKALSPWCTVGPQKPEQLSWAHITPPHSLGASTCRETKAEPGLG